MREKLEHQLSQLGEDLIQMGILIEKSLQKVILILNAPSQEVVREIKEFEAEVDSLERSVQSRALRILFTQQPVAGDLRSVSTALNIITDMERVADQACDIAEITVYLGGNHTLEQPAQIRLMVDECIAMVKGSVDAFVTQNLAVAQKVIDMDDRVDALFLEVRDALVKAIKANADCGEAAIDFVMVAKYLERIADHAVNIAEWVIFNITGQHKNQKLL